MSWSWGPCLPPCCWRCSSCPSSPCWPSRCLTSCRSPSPTRTLHHRVALWHTSSEGGQDTHLSDDNRSQWCYTHLFSCVWICTAAANCHRPGVFPPFGFRGFSALWPGFGASGLEPVQQRFRFRDPLTIRSPAFHSGSFSLSGITSMLCSGALGQQPQKQKHSLVIITPGFYWCSSLLTLVIFLNKEPYQQLFHFQISELMFRVSWIKNIQWRLPGDSFCLPAIPLSLIIPECSARLDALCFLFLAFGIFSQLQW